MRKVWLTILVAIAFAANGFAGAAMASGCPTQAGSAMQMAQVDHAITGDPCCDDHRRANHNLPQKSMDSCSFGMSCQSTPAMAPSAQSIRMPAISLRVQQPLLGEPAPPSGLLQDLFRPPRNI